MGPLDQLPQMLPGVGGAKALKNLQVDEKQLDRIQAIIQSMTVEESGTIRGSSTAAGKKGSPWAVALKCRMK